jgi:hypothetical protein
MGARPGPAGPAEELFRQTNPIWRCALGDRDRMCETNPISRRGPVARDLGKAGRGCCTNKPNSCPHADPEVGVPGRANRAKRSQFRGSGWDRRAKRAKQSQTWASRGVWGTGQGDEPRADASNKPNSRPGRLGQGLANEGLLRKTNPICGVKCAERSQFRPVWWTEGFWSPLPYAGVTLQVRPQDNPVARAAVVE